MAPKKNQMGQGLQLEELSVSKLAATFRECFSFKPSSNPLFHRIVPLSSWRGPRKKKVNHQHWPPGDHWPLPTLGHSCICHGIHPRKISMEPEKGKTSTQTFSFCVQNVSFRGHTFREACLWLKTLAVNPSPLKSSREHSGFKVFARSCVDL